MRTALLITFLGALGVITWNEVRTLQRVPHPESYMHAVWVWAILGIVSEIGASDIAALFGFGLLLSMLYTYYQGKPNPLTPAATGGSTAPVTQQPGPTTAM